MGEEQEKAPSVVRIGPGEVLIHEGGLPAGLYVLLRGKLEVVRDGVLIAYLSQKGAYVGEISAILGCPSTATVRAVEPSELMHIQKVTEYLDLNPQVAYVIAQTLAARIMAMNERFVAVEHLLRQLMAAEMSESSGQTVDKINEALMEMRALVSSTETVPSFRHRTAKP